MTKGRWMTFTAGILVGSLAGALVVVGLSQSTTDTAASPSPSPSASGAEEPRTYPKNVILFVGDGMSISTLTAARIFEGQQRGESGEDHQLSFEEFPSVALSKTYSVDYQVPDSAATITALMTGVKTNNGMINVDPGVKRGSCPTTPSSALESWMMFAERQGMATGVVSTVELTDATPAGAYGVSAERSWGNDTDVPVDCQAAVDLASQLLAFEQHGDGLEVAFGGGRGDFQPLASGGLRNDGRDLTAEWDNRGDDWAYVSTASDLEQRDLSQTTHVLGLFADTTMGFQIDRDEAASDQPTLATMTTTAIQQLSTGKEGFALLVESGLIDRAHHQNQAARALSETVALSDAVRAAMAEVDMSETLIIVTADHGQALTISGYPLRGNDIFGLAGASLDACGQPYTTLNYATGPGAAPGVGACGRLAPPATGLDEPNSRQQSLVPTSSSAHSGDDVAVFAAGVGSEAVAGLREQDYFGRVLIWAVRKDGSESPPS